jgi:hypothetical protein
MAESIEKLPKTLRSVDDISKAHEWLFHEQVNGGIDPKRADGINTTLKGIVKLQVDTRLKYLQIVTRAEEKKIKLPPQFIPLLS